MYRPSIAGNSVAYSVRQKASKNIVSTEYNNYMPLEPSYPYDEYSDEYVNQDYYVDYSPCETEFGFHKIAKIFLY